MARLEAQAALSWAEEWRVLQELGFPKARTVLDMGSGSGAVTTRLKMALPGRMILGLDLDFELLHHARADGAPFACGRAEQLPLATASFDAALVRYVMQHLQRPPEALAELHRVLRPGGLLAIVDIDAQLWGMAEPSVPEFAHVYREVARAQARAGGNRLIGRQMTRMLAASGFTDIAVRPFAVTSDTRHIDQFAVHLGPDRLTPFVKSGTLSREDYATVVRGWQRFRRDPSAWILLMGFVFAGRAA